MIMSARFRSRDALKSCVIALALLPGAALAANAVGAKSGTPPPTSASQQNDELDEVIVSGGKPADKPSTVILWMRRLVGRFTFEGNVDLHGKGNPEDLRPVQGSGDCTGSGPAPAVQCELHVRWPAARGPQGEEIVGGVSTLDPAMILYAYEPIRNGVRYLLVDSKGIAQAAALGLLAGNTLTSTTPCVNIPGNCQQVTRITARPDLKVVEMQIDLERDYRKAVRYTFVLRRVPGSPVFVPGTPP